MQKSDDLNNFFAFISILSVLAESVITTSAIIFQAPVLYLTSLLQKAEHVLPEYLLILLQVS